MRYLEKLRCFGAKWRGNKLETDSICDDLVESAQADMHRESLCGFYVFMVLQGLYTLLYFLYSRTHSANMVPLASASASFAFNLGTFVFWRVTKSKHIFQASRLMALALDAVLGALVNPCVQWILWDSFSLYSFLGKRPGCTRMAQFTPGICTVYDECVLSAVLVQGRIMFEVLFILRFWYARIGLCVSVIIYCSLMELSAKIMSTSKPVAMLIIVQTMVVIVAKWRMESFQYLVCVQLAQKAKQVTWEKVLRCQAEFKNELVSDGSLSFSAEHECHDTTVASEVTGSSMIFGHWDEQSSDVMAKLQKVYDLAAKERWLINHSEIVLQADRICGVGSFGVVVAGSVLGAPVAVKFVRNIVDSRRLRGVAELATELRILRQTRHPNIVLLYGACVDLNSHAFALVSEFIDGPDLHICLKSKAADGRKADLPVVISPNIRYKLLVDVCRALLYLHKRDPGIVHGDLKPGNTLVEHIGKRLRAKLVDFGLSRILTEGAKPLGGTLRYMAPELKKRGASGLRPSPSADVFSLGRLAYVITNGRKPFDAYENQELPALLKCASPSLEWEPSGIANLCKPSAESCMCADPSLRPTINEVYQDVSSWPSFAGDGEILAEESEDSVSMYWDDALHHLESKGHVKNIGCKNPPRSATPLARHQQNEDQLHEDDCVLCVQQQEPEQRREQQKRQQQAQSQQLLNPSGQIEIGERMDARRQVEGQSLQSTPPSSILVLLTHMLTRCSVPLGPGDCCRMHAAAREASAVLSLLQEGQCIATVVEEDWQCPICKVLCPVGSASHGYCDVCGCEMDFDLTGGGPVDAPPSTKVFAL